MERVTRRPLLDIVCQLRYHHGIIVQLTLSMGAGGRQRHADIRGREIRHNAVRAEQIQQARKYFHLPRPTAVDTG